MKIIYIVIAQNGQPGDDYLVESLRAFVSEEQAKAFVAQLDAEKTEIKNKLIEFENKYQIDKYYSTSYEEFFLENKADIINEYRSERAELLISKLLTVLAGGVDAAQVRTIGQTLLGYLELWSDRESWPETTYNYYRLKLDETAP